MNQLKQRRPKLISDPRVTKIQEFKTNNQIMHIIQLMLHKQRVMQSYKKNVK